MTNHHWNVHILTTELFKVVNSLYSFPANSFTKYKIKSNPNMYILMCFKIQIDQPRTTLNAFKMANFSFTY